MTTYFYHGTLLQVAFEEGRSRTVLRTTCGPMAVLQRNIDETSAELLTIDKAGSVLRLLTYTCFGDSAVSHVQPPLLAFNAQRRDPFTGCYLLGNGRRVYNPVLMRFHSPDALSPFGKGGVNAYAYCEGDPVNWQDESGQGREQVYHSAKGTNTEYTSPVKNPSEANPLKTAQKDLGKPTNTKNRKVSFSSEITTFTPTTQETTLLRPLSNLVEKQEADVFNKSNTAEIDSTRENLIALGKSISALNSTRKILDIARKISPPKRLFNVIKTQEIRSDAVASSV